MSGSKGSGKPVKPSKKPKAAAKCKGTKAKCAAAKKPCEFQAQIVSITWDKTVKAARRKKTVKSPHWKDGARVNDGPGSKRPGIYRIKGVGSHDVTVEIKVKKSNNCSGPAKLTGEIADVKGTGPKLVVEGSCPVSVGTHSVSAKIVAPPDKIKWYRGDMTWKLEVPKHKTLSLKSTRVEVFVILATPISAFQAKKGDWVEALRFLCEKVNVQDDKKPEDVASKVTSYFHSRHGLAYDTSRGASKYGVGSSGGNFKLGD